MGGWVGGDLGGKALVWVAAQMGRRACTAASTVAQLGVEGRRRIGCYRVCVCVCVCVFLGGGKKLA